MNRTRRLAVSAVAIVAAAAGTLQAWFATHPFPYDLEDHRVASYRFVDREGRLLREAVGDAGARQVWVSLDEMSPWLVEATIAIEDRRFRSHAGIDPVGVGRAVVDNLRAGGVVSGASTLSMQLARLVAGHPRTARGKVLQAIDALRLERVATKDTILEHYLNRAPYGAGAIGVEAASQRTFGKHSRLLSLAEAAMLAGLPQAPSALHPFVDPDAAVRRQHQVLDALRATGRITAEEHARALAEPLMYVDGSPRPEAMHLTDHLLSRGLAPGVVHTTIDRALQRQVQAFVADHVDALRGGGMTQAAVVVLDNERCDVLVMVGSADWWGEGGRANGAMSPRQPGSALKPFAYGAAWEGGYDPASVVADVPTRYLDGDGLLMRPRNYSERFSGPVLMGEALARSLNVPAVRTTNAVGLAEVLATMRAAGLASLSEDPGEVGLGVVLGNGEVTLVELAAAYAMLARGGLTCTPRLTVDDPVAAGTRVFSERTAFLVTDVLADEALRARAFGVDNPLMVGFPVAVKTGTSSNFRDAWAVGYTGRHTVAVWTGDFAGRPMDRMSGAIGAGPLFRQVMREVTLGGRASTLPPAPVPPDDVVAVEVCARSGHAPTDRCPRRTVRLPVDRTERPECAWHQTIRIDRRNGLRASDTCPEAHVTERVFTVLPATYAAWQADQGTAPPAGWSPLCPPDDVAADAVVVTHPAPGDVFVLEPGYPRATQSVELTVEVDPPVPEVTWVVDGREVGRSAWPYTGAWALDPGEHELVALAGGRLSEPVRFEVR